jgi:hypothetical protein
MKRSVLMFAARFTLVFAILLAPLPYVADTYAIAIGNVTNAILWALDWPSPIAFRYEPPGRITPNGSWKIALRMEDRDVRRAVVAPLDLRSFSYRPMAAFVALAAASTRRGLRRNAIVWGGGLGLMLALTTLFSALPVLSRYATRGLLGSGLGSAAITAYRALATPVMMYAIAAIAWWTVMRLAEDHVASAGDSTPLGSVRSGWLFRKTLGPPRSGKPPGGEEDN